MSTVKVYDFEMETQQEDPRRIAFVAETYEQYIRDYPVQRYIANLASNQRLRDGMMTDVNHKFRNFEWWQNPGSEVEISDIERVRKYIATIISCAMYSPAHKYWGDFPVIDRKIPVVSGGNVCTKMIVDDYNTMWAQKGVDQYVIPVLEVNETEITTEIPTSFNGFPPPSLSPEVDLIDIKSVLDYDDQQLRELLGIA